MTQRERYHDFITNQNPDNIPMWGDWIGPYSRWITEGLPPQPPEYAEGKKGCRGSYLMDYFGSEIICSAYWGTSRLPVSLGIGPAFEYKVLEQNDDHMIYQNGDGMILKEMTHKKSSLVTQQYLDHALHGPSDWEDFKNNHLDPDYPRYPDDETWNAIVSECKNRDFVVTVDAGSFYGIMRNWMTVEDISIVMYEEPDWVLEASNYLADFYIKILERAVRDVPDIDAAVFWEDMCFKNGPLCSPDMFRRFFLPGYKKVTKFLRDNGVSSFWVDCDGNIELLIDLWIEGGVNGFYPLEVASGMDALKLKKKYGDRVLLWGGVDKRELRDGPEAIEAELARRIPAAKMGGYIPLVDHGVPEDISFDNYVYYDKRRKELLGLKPLPTNNKRNF